MDIVYDNTRSITDAEFIDVLSRSTLGERRPVGDPAAIAAMLQHANLLCTAWDGEKLIGVARSLTDFEFCCYLSDLAVDSAYQRRGIGRRLIELTEARLGPKAKVILLAAPMAVDYYPHIGFSKHNSAWILNRGEGLKWG
jgi:ribosomal protein S18 acetylase RimI-like enzyme